MKDGGQCEQTISSATIRPLSQGKRRLDRQSRTTLGPREEKWVKASIWRQKAGHKIARLELGRLAAQPQAPYLPQRVNWPSNQVFDFGFECIDSQWAGGTCSAPVLSDHRGPQP